MGALDLDGVSKDWVTIVIRFYARWYDAWDITIVITSWATFASVCCAILLWSKDRTDKLQKLFPE